MKLSFRPFLIGLVVLVISACGFHLRGWQQSARTLPFTHWQVSGDLSAEIDKSLTRYNAIYPAQTATQTAEITSGIVRKGRDVRNTNHSGAVSEYVMFITLRIEGSIKGEPLGEPIEVSARRNYAYSDNELLGKQQEEEMIAREMQQDVIDQAIYRMTFWSHNRE